MAAILNGPSGQPLQFTVKPNVNGDDVATESAISTPNNALIKSALNAGGAAPVYACRAWVNFGGGGVITDSQNVLSVTLNSAGNFTINFDEPMNNNSYVVCFNIGIGGVSVHGGADTVTIGAMTQASVRVFSRAGNGAPFGFPFNTVAVFG